MNRAAAAAGSAAFFVLAPGVIAGLVPWWLTRYRVMPTSAPPRWLGVVLLAAGVGVLISAFVQFAAEGIGTPAPIASTEHLVVRGLYRYVGNPMYLAVLATIAGQALILGQVVLGIYALSVALAFVAFVRGYEEPTLRRRYGAEYESYQRAVPGWWGRALIYGGGFHAAEYLSGRLFRRLLGRAPWEYSDARWQLDGLIRFDYFPVWAAAGLVTERLHDILTAQTRIRTRRPERP